MSFWNSLNKPIIVSAPLADVTDPAFRKLLAKYGKPDITWTEFVSADGLYHTREVKKMRDEENPLLRDLQFSEAERPIVAQLFTSSPETMAYAAKLAAELGFDGVDVNMGCPDDSIEKQGAGAAMIQHPEAAQAVIRAAKESGLPVSVKTRIGYTEEILDEWLPALFEAEPVAVTVHLRTRKEMSLVPARWDLMQKAVTLRARLAPGILMLGNGDVKSLEEAKQKAKDTGADGIMIGRGMFGNFWVFAGKKPEDVSREEKLAALIELAHEYEKLKPAKPFHILKKHVKAFVSGFDGAAELRGKLMEANSAGELDRVISENPL